MKLMEPEILLSEIKKKLQLVLHRPNDRNIVTCHITAFLGETHWTRLATLS